MVISGGISVLSESKIVGVGKYGGGTDTARQRVLLINENARRVGRAYLALALRPAVTEWRWV